MQMHSRETRSRPVSVLRRALVAACGLAFASNIVGCGVFFGVPEHASREKLRASKALSDCRWEARRDCYYQSKEDASLDRDVCISDLAWQCALDSSNAAKAASTAKEEEEDDGDE